MRCDITQQNTGYNTIYVISLFLIKVTEYIRLKTIVL